MKIRTRLTLMFLLWGAVIMLIASLSIYYTSSNFRKDDFYNRLRNKSRSTAKLLFDAKSIEPERVLKIEKDNPINLQNEKIIIINFLNDIVYSTDSTKEIKIENSVLERVRTMQVVKYLQDDFQVVASIYTAKFDRFVLIAAATDIEGKYFLEKLRNTLLTVFFLSLFLFALAGWIYSGRALKPISDVTKKAESISVSSLNLRVPVVNESDEIGHLSKTFNNMLSRLESSFTMQKNFIANASHEMRTPLTAIKGQLEVLLMKERNEEEYKLAVTSILDDTRAMTELLNRLLIVAKTSSGNYNNPDKKLRIDEILWQAADEIRKTRKNYQIGISLNDSVEDAEQLVVSGDEALLKVAIANIMDNGCKYSPDHTIQATIGVDRKNIFLQFADNGIGIAKEEIDKVFEPFFRASNAKTFPGTGIGLQLVNQIIKSHKGVVKIESERGKGTIVSVYIPSV